MASVTGTIESRVKLTQSETAALGAQRNFPLDHVHEQGYASGTGDNQADQVYAVAHSLAASASATIDLNGSADQDVNGNDLAFGNVRELIFRAPSTNGDAIRVAPGDTNPFAAWIGGTTPYIDVFPGAEFRLRFKSGAQ